MICSCMSTRSAVEKRLIFVVVGLSLLSICFLIPLIVVSLPKKASLDQEVKVCETLRCKDAAEYYRSSMDKTLDPCQDFFAYSCDSWRSRHNTSMEVNTQLRHDAHQIALEILRGAKQPINGFSKSLKNAINFYSMCNNATRINKRGLNPVRKSLEGLGGWPAIQDDWKSEDYNWMEAEVQTLLWTRLSLLVGFVITVDPRNTSKQIVQLGFISARGNTKDVDYYNSIRNVLAYIDDRKDYRADIEDIIGLENELMEEYDAVQENLTVLTVAELTDKTGLDCLAYLQLLTNETSLNITDESEVVTEKIQYLQKLGEIVSNQTESRRIANFLAWKFLSFNWFLLPDGVVAQFEPQIDPSHKDDACYDFVLTVFSDILTNIYIKNYFQIPTKDKSQKLMEILLETFLSVVEQTDWLDDKTRALALQKARAIKFHSAFPDWLNNATAVEETYAQMKEIDVDREDVMEAYLMLSQFHVRNSLLSTTKTKTLTSPFEVNARYSRTTNEFAVAAGMLKPPFYHDQNPRYVNIGAIGSVIGHEITHAFDGQGRVYDPTAVRRNWWNESTVAEFLRRAECFGRQYEKYGVTGFANKRGEIIADNGGIRIAFKTYKNLQAKEEDLLLPGFEDFTSDQLFFLAFGMIYCSTTDTVSEQFQYSPKRLRVNIPLQNMKEFAEAFHCDWSSSMNPTEKCILW